MKLIIVRHGETDRNQDKHAPYSGPVELNALGRKQAAAVARRLKNEKIDSICVSDMIRAQQTADIIAKFHPHVHVVVDSAIRERDTGVFERRTVHEREESQRASGQSFRDWRPEGGESIRDVKKRAAAWLEKMLALHGNDSVLVVSHGHFLYTLLEVAVEDGADVEREDFSMSNCGLTVLEVYPEGRPRVIHLNHTGHLSELGTRPSSIGEQFKRPRHA